MGKWIRIAAVSLTGGRGGEIVRHLKDNPASAQVMDPNPGRDWFRSRCSAIIVVDEGSHDGRLLA